MIIPKKDLEKYIHNFEEQISVIEFNGLVRIIHYLITPEEVDFIKNLSEFISEETRDLELRKHLPKIINAILELLKKNENQEETENCT